MQASVDGHCYLLPSCYHPLHALNALTRTNAHTEGGVLSRRGAFWPDTTLSFSLSLRPDVGHHAACQSLLSCRHIDSTRELDTYLSNRIDMHSHASSSLYDPVTLTFDLRVNACRGPAVEYMCSTFGVDSSRRFYRAMHYSAKRGLAIACRLSVCLW